MNNHEMFFAVLFTALVILLLIAGMFIVIFSANRQKLKQSMKITRMELDYEKELRTAETEISEQVLTQLGRELHDNIGQLLTLMRLQIENNKLDHPALASILEPVETTLNNTSEQVRDISRSLNSDYISQRGLLASLEAEVLRLKQLKRPAVHWNKLTNELNLDKNKQLIIFRIFQEMVNNCLKHSKAENLSIYISNMNGFSLEVSDDGIGFQLEEMMQSDKPSGLTNMNKRALMAGLQFSIDTSPGQGCRYLLKA